MTASQNHNPPGQSSNKSGYNHGQNIQVYVRVRPSSHEERVSRSSNVLSCPTAREVSVQEKPFSHMTKSFSFDRVFCDISGQSEVFKTVVHPLIKQVLDGYNCTVFAYGQTGTGKTYTMEGLKDYSPHWEEDESAGIIPRSLIEIFEHKKRVGLDKSGLQIKASFLELYNEEIFDLLAKNLDSDKKLKIFEDSSKKGSVIVQGLEEVVVETKDEVLKILQEGSMKRQTAATKMNATSSRSHTIFTITLTVTEKSIVGQEKFIEGKLNLVDLAGSENIGRSGAVDKRAREAGKINESLLTLGRVINNLVKRETHIPYRESKLTRLLQDSLGGRTKTSIIATVSPASINLEETLSTLDYAHRAKNITNRPEINQKIPVASKLAEMQSKIDFVRRELEDQRLKDGGVFLSQEQKDTLEQRSLELTQLKKGYDELNTLFEVKSSANEQLKRDLKLTISELTAKCDEFECVKEERDVQTHLVSKHVETESKIRNQALQLISTADSQKSDLNKLHEVNENRMQIEGQNLESLKRFSSSMNGLVSTLVDQLMCASEKGQIDVLNSLMGEVEKMKKSCQFFSSQQIDLMQSDRDELHQTLSGVESDATNGKKFVTDFNKSLKSLTEEISKSRSEVTDKHVEDVCSNLKKITDVACQHQSVAKQMTDKVSANLTENDKIVASMSTNISKTTERCRSTHDKNENEMSKLNNSLSERLNALESRLNDSLKESEEETNILIKHIEKAHEKRVKSIVEMRRDVESIRTENGSLSVLSKSNGENIKSSIINLDKELNSFVSEIGELTSSAQETLTSHSEKSVSVDMDRVSRLADQISTDFISRLKSEIVESDVKQRERVDRLTDDMTSKVDTVSNDICDACQKLEMSTSCSVERLNEMCVSHEKEVDVWCEEMMKEKITRAIEDCESKHMEMRDHCLNKIINDCVVRFTSRGGLTKYQSTGSTPAREERSYPCQLINATPDDVRVDRFKQFRNKSGSAGNTVRLNIESAGLLDENDECEKNRDEEQLLSDESPTLQSPNEEEVEISSENGVSYGGDLSDSGSVSSERSEVNSKCKTVGNPSTNILQLPKSLLKQPETYISRKNKDRARRQVLSEVKGHEN